MKTCELEGAALDWAVAKAIGKQGVYICPNSPQKTLFIDDENVPFGRYIWSPSTDWSQGAPLVEKHVNHVEKYALTSEEWVVWVGNDKPGQCGPTMLIAAMRAIVAAELGDTVDVPEELTQ